MELVKYADALFTSHGLSLVRDEEGKYDAVTQRARQVATNALRAENEKLAAERDARELAKEEERAKIHGPRVLFEMVDGLSPEQVDREIGRARRAGDIGHRTMAFYLADCADRGLFQDLGHSSVIVYAVKRHDLSRRTARDLILAGRSLHDLVKVDDAFSKNAICWSKVRAIAKVADVATEDQWLAFALSHTLEEVEKEAALSNKGDKPREDRKGLHEVRFNLKLRVSALIHEQYLLARQKLGAEAGRNLTDEEFAGAAFEALLRKPGEGTQSSDSLYRVFLDMRLPEGAATIRSEDGPVEVEDSLAEAICCDSGVITEDGKRHGHYAPPIPDSLRQRILARDGWRCVICGSAIQLHVHHIVWREHGGSNAWSNLAATCKACHAMIHGGLLVVTGEAPDRLEIRDRKGELVVDPSRVIGRGDPRSLEIAAAPPPRSPSSTPEGDGPYGPPNSGFCAAGQGVMATIPAGSIDRDWLLRHKDLVVLDAARGGFRLEEGMPLREAAVVPPEVVGEATETANPLRPATLDAIVGQRTAVERLRSFARSSKNTGRMPAPALLLGASGLGKTTLARAYARELGFRLRAIDCTTLDDPHALIGHLIDLRDQDVVFLDEIHALPKSLAEVFYSAIEDGVMTLPFVDGIAMKSVPFLLPKVTFVGATTNQERLPAPLRGRFQEVDLSPYGVEDLAEIVRRAAARDGSDVAPEAASVLAKASAGTARRAISLYVEMRTFVGARAGASATADDARAALALAEIDENGIGPVHRRILEALRRYGRPMALGRLVAQVGITVKAFRTIYEPALVYVGAIGATPRGMILGHALV